MRGGGGGGGGGGGHIKVGQFKEGFFPILRREDLRMIICWGEYKLINLFDLTKLTFTFSQVWVGNGIPLFCGVLHH